jgi:hypothetical protein
MKSAGFCENAGKFSGVIKTGFALGSFFKNAGHPKINFGLEPLSTLGLREYLKPDMSLYDSSKYQNYSFTYNML